MLGGTKNMSWKVLELSLWMLICNIFTLKYKRDFGEPLLLKIIGMEQLLAIIV